MLCSKPPLHWMGLRKQLRARGERQSFNVWRSASSMQILPMFHFVLNLEHASSCQSSVSPEISTRGMIYAKTNEAAKGSGVSQARLLPRGGIKLCEARVRPLFSTYRRSNYCPVPAALWCCFDDGLDGPDKRRRVTLPRVVSKTIFADCFSLWLRGQDAGSPGDQLQSLRFLLPACCSVPTGMTK